MEYLFILGVIKELINIEDAIKCNAGNARLHFVGYVIKFLLKKKDIVILETMVDVHYLIMKMNCWSNFWI